MELDASMTLNDYQQYAMCTRTPETYCENCRIIYPTLGLTGEAGETADKVKKVLRDHHGIFTNEQKRAIALELGDTLWYAAALALDLGYTLEEVCQMNLDKLSDRNLRNKIHGSGDNR